MNVVKDVAMNQEESLLRNMAMGNLQALEDAGKVIDIVYENEKVKQQYSEVNSIYDELRALLSDNPRALELLLSLEDNETDLMSIVSDEYFTLGYSNGAQFIHNLKKELNG